MSTAMVRDVAILGAGSAGLWLANQLAQKKISSVLFDESPFGSYASTHNQGWLQTAALYVATGKPDFVSESTAGYNATVNLIGEESRAVPPLGGFFLFDRLADRSSFIRACTGAVEVQPVTSLHLSGSVPFLSHGASFGAQVPDHYIDTHTLLTALADGAQPWVRFQSVSGGPAALQLVRRDKNWSVRWEDAEAVFGAVVLACGTLIPALWEKVGIRLGGVLSTVKMPVLVLHREITNRLLVWPLQARGPIILPCTRDGAERVTVSVSGSDVPAGGHEDIQFTRDQGNHIANTLGVYLPGLEEECAQEPIPCHLYTCQKLRLDRAQLTDPALQRRILFDHGEMRWGGQPGLLTFYPRRFSAASEGAKECAEHIAQRLAQADTSGATSFSDSEEPPAVAHQLYYEDPTGKLVWSEDRLTILWR